MSICSNQGCQLTSCESQTRYLYQWFSQCGPRLRASPSPGKLLAIQILRFNSKPTKSKNSGGRTQSSVFCEALRVIPIGAQVRETPTNSLRLPFLMCRMGFLRPTLQSQSKQGKDFGSLTVTFYHYHYHHYY